MWAPPSGLPIAVKPGAVKPGAGADLTGGPNILREQPPDAERLPGSAESQRRWTLVAAALILLGAALATTGLLARRPGAVVASVHTTGELTVDSTPAGASVVIAGEDRGRTPLSVRLPPGSYDVELRRGPERHVVAARVNAGATTAQHVVLSGGGAPSSGRLRITSDPPSASVTVDGEHQGRTPVLVTDLAPGPHEVVVTGTAGQATRRVHVNAATTTLLSVPLSRQAAAPAAEAADGWVAVRSPVELQVFEGKRLLGTTRSARLVLPTGPHTLRFANEAAGVNESRPVTIEPGKTTRLDVAVPMGTMSINATPWATVSIDGREVGETPLGGLEVAAGPHEVVFRHPELGEQRQRITLRAGVTTRLSVDMRR
jgi:PEGA domain